MVLVTARLFPTDSQPADPEASSPFAARLDRVAAALHSGATLEIGLPNEPMVTPEDPASVQIAGVLRPHLQSGRLKLYRLRTGTDVARVPRVIANPGRAGGFALFSTSVTDTDPLMRGVPSPTWIARGGTEELLRSLMNQWEILPATVLDLPAGIVVYDYSPGQARSIARDFVFAKNKEFSRLRIDDPFALRGPANAECIRRLLEMLTAIWKRFPADVFLRTREAADVDTGTLEAGLRNFIEAHGTKLTVYKVPAAGPRRRDFHDRRLVFTTAAQKPQTIEVLLTGGVDRYVESRFETSVIIRRT